MEQEGSRCAGPGLCKHLRGITPSEKPAYTSLFGKSSAATRPRSMIVPKPCSPAAAWVTAAAGSGRWR